MIHRKIRKRIIEKLKEIEQEHEVKILFAIESGSRAWGFESVDSDYDVRFVYAHKRDWYLSIFPGRDVIEYPIDDELDISGWDIKKALELFYKSNPAFLEWIKSPITYVEQTTFRDEILKLEKEYFSRIHTLHHYLSMAKQTHHSHLQKDSVKLKKYLYALRPLFACRWIEQYGEAPPMEFDTLLQTLGKNHDTLLVAISDLLQKKKRGGEIMEGLRIPVINNFVESEIERIEASIPKEKKPKGDLEKLNHLFQKIIG